MAHGNLSVLEKSLQLLDNERNDMYIHIDKKTTFDKIKLKKNVKKSKVFFVEQMNVYWGGYSQIDCELKLLKASIKEKYIYYHLLSGNDLPLKNQDEIHDFFERNHGKEFIHFERSSVDNNAKDRVKYYYPLQEKLEENRVKYFIQHFLLKYMQKAIGINRLEKNNIEIQKGANWFSITQPLAEYVIESEKKIKKIFRKGYCVDELFLQTLVWNSKENFQLYNYGSYNDYSSCQRKIDWNRGKPYVWRSNDYAELISSNYLFARKFDSRVDNEIVEKIFRKIKKNLEEDQEI